MTLGDDRNRPDEKWRAEHAFEIRKWRADVLNQKREIALRERAQVQSEKELALKEEGAKISRWSNPLVLAIIGAILAGLANAGVSAINNYYQLRMEETHSAWPKES